MTELRLSQRDLEKEVALSRDFSNLSDAPPLSIKNLKHLYKWLIEPIKSRLKTLLVGIIPHGILHKLPFTALTDGKRYLSDKYMLFDLPSVSSFRYIQQNRKPGGGSLLAIAYGEGEGLPFLDYSKVEAQSIAQLYHTDARVGAAATESAFCTRAGEHDIVHLAAHFELNTINPLFSRLMLAPDKGADGSLELQEVYGLNLKKTDLVVLSVCQSQLGAHSRGDDITALSRAFLYAGTPTVIGSLWSIDDEATVRLMTSLYKHLKEGMSKAAALREAQFETRAMYPHPYYWAGFVLTGHPGIISSHITARN